MNSELTVSSIDGFDPLAVAADEAGPTVASFLEEANKREVHNILKSYTGYFDVFSEMLQNALDAVQTRQRTEGAGYQPRIWVEIDMPARLVRVTDNGVGMTDQEFKYCLRPSVSFKKQEADLRGHKGVGATFLAYGFSFLKLQSKRNGTTLAAVLRQGRQWAEDSSGTVPRPKFEGVEFEIPQLHGEASGTCFEIILGGSSGERPQDLGWLGAQSAEQWYTVLRIKTPLGGVYLSTPPFKPEIVIRVISSDKTVGLHKPQRAEYFYPHEIPNLKVQSLQDITKALDRITGDPSTKLAKLEPEFKRLDCIYEIWSKAELLSEDSYFASALAEEQRTLIERHNVIIYACFLRSAKIWGDVNDDTFGLRRGLRILRGGLQLASDFMVQGDLSIIPLTSTIGYQANSHVIVHFTDGDPDLGRKVFQPELKSLAETLSVRAVTICKRFLQHLKPDTGAQSIIPDKELHDWKKEQEAYRDRNPLAFVHAGARVALISVPRQEQDVVALFHELIGAGILKGFRFYGTSQSDRYDSLFYMEYLKEDDVLFDVAKQRLGIRRDYVLPYTTEPKVLEYKFAFGSLIEDFDKEEKFSKQIDAVVCWNAGAAYKAKFDLQPLLVGDEGSSRGIFGATHQAFAAGQSTPAFEVILLEDLLGWLRDPVGEEAHQKRAYRDS